jgi:hypothetical protein
VKLSDRLKPQGLWPKERQQHERHPPITASRLREIAEAHAHELGICSGGCDQYAGYAACRAMPQDCGCAGSIRIAIVRGLRCPKGKW